MMSTAAADPTGIPVNHPAAVHIAAISRELEVTALEAPEWSLATPVRIDRYWSGAKAPLDRSFTARLLWSPTSLHVKFLAQQHEPLIVSDDPQITQKTLGLWERDVCEIFIAPEPCTPNRYFEFEIAPTGEWLDLAIEITPTGRITNWDYTSEMESSARPYTNQVAMGIRVPFHSLGKKPKAGDTWLGNFYRCVGRHPTRGYLAWQPTKTEKPSFHVPAAFGELVFAD
jgi:alpha-galactosidase